MTRLVANGGLAKRRGAEGGTAPPASDGTATDLSQQQAFLVELGSRLRSTRVAKGLGLGRVEVMTGGEFKASVLGAYERGERALSVLRLHRLSRIYNVDIEELLPLSTERANWEYRLDMPGGDKLLTAGPGWVQAAEPGRGHVPLRHIFAATVSMRRKLLMVGDHAKMLEMLVVKLDEGRLSGAERKRLSNVLIGSAAELGEALTSDWALRADQASHLQALTAIREAVCAAAHQAHLLQTRGDEQVSGGAPG